jgi:putative DNA primase/helicase
VRVNPSRTAKERLVSWLQNSQAEKVYVTSRIGWHGDSFVLPERVIAPPGAERILYHGGAANRFQVKGTLEEWRQQIGQRCVSNSRLVFAVSAAFTGPLLHLVEQGSGGFHFRGSASIGKSITLLVADSEWGAEAEAS